MFQKNVNIPNIIYSHTYKKKKQFKELVDKLFINNWYIPKYNV